MALHGYVTVTSTNIVAFLDVPMTSNIVAFLDVPMTSKIVAFLDVPMTSTNIDICCISRCAVWNRKVFARSFKVSSNN